MELSNCTFVAVCSLANAKLTGFVSSPRKLPASERIITVLLRFSVFYLSATGFDGANPMR